MVVPPVPMTPKSHFVCILNCRLHFIVITMFSIIIVLFNVFVQTYLLFHWTKIYYYISDRNIQTRIYVRTVDKLNEKRSWIRNLGYLFYLRSWNLLLMDYRVILFSLSVFFNVWVVLICLTIYVHHQHNTPL